MNRAQSTAAEWGCLCHEALGTVTAAIQRLRVVRADNDRFLLVERTLGPRQLACVVDADQRIRRARQSFADACEAFADADLRFRRARQSFAAACNALEQSKRNIIATRRQLERGTTAKIPASTLTAAPNSGKRPSPTPAAA